MAPDQSTANAVIGAQPFSEVESDRAPAPAAKLSPAPVLVVDDNPSKRLALKAVLQPLGYPVVEADSGRAALRCVMAQDFAVILLDVCMPDMDGFETAALIRQRQQSELTPIVFITAFGSDEIQNTHRYAEGPVDFIFAPVEPDALRSKVSAFARLFMKAASLTTQAADVQAVADQIKAPYRRHTDRDLPDRRRTQIRVHQPALVRDHRCLGRRSGWTKLGHHRRSGTARRSRRRVG